MINENNPSFYWDTKVKVLAVEVIKKATADKEIIEHYVGAMIFAVEHDLADGRFPALMSINSLMQVKGVFSSDSYFANIHPKTRIEEIERMKNLSKEVGILMNMKQ